MKTRTALAAALLATSAGLAAAAPLPDGMKPPTTAAPAFYPIQRADMEQGVLEVEHYSQQSRPVTVTRYLEHDGKLVPVALTEQQTACMVETRRFALRGNELFTADGKALARKDAAKHLVPGAVLLVCWDRLPEPAYLKLFKPETVILLVKSGQFPQSVAPPPPPPVKDKDT